MKVVCFRAPVSHASPAMDSRRRLPSLLLFTLAALILVLVSADAGIDIPDEKRPEIDDFGLRKETDPESSTTDVLKEIKHLQSQLEALENILKEKDSSLQEKEKRISFLESELNGVQQKGSPEGEERLVVAQDRASGLEVQVEKLQLIVEKLEIQLQIVKERVESSEASVVELLNKNSKATKTIDRQQKRLRSEEEALQKIEAALQQAEFEAAKKDDELAKAGQAWLPPWFAVFLDRFQELAILEWDEHGKPVMTILSTKAHQISAAARELAKPHLETVKKKWIPVAQQQLENAIILIVPHMETAKIKASNGFEFAKSYLSCHVQTVEKALRPYTELVRNKARPYVDEVAVFVQPYFKSAQKALKAHMEKAHNTYQKFLELRNSLEHNISKHETLEALAGKKFIWFLKREENHQTCSKLRWLT